MTHDPLCPLAPPTSDYAPYLAEAVSLLQQEAACQCELIAKVRADELRRPSEDGWMSVRAVLAWEDQVRADERAKYVLPDLPRGGEHVDWCRDLACYGCEEIAEGVIAQRL